MRNKVSAEIKSARQSYYQNKFLETNSDPRKTWQVVNELPSRETDKSLIKEIKLDEVF